MKQIRTVVSHYDDIFQLENDLTMQAVDLLSGHRVVGAGDSS